MGSHFIQVSLYILISHKFKGAASALYFTDGTREIIEHKNGGYGIRASKVKVGNGVLQACLAWSHFKPKHRYSRTPQV